MNQKRKKYMQIILIVFVIICITFSSIMSQDNQHIEICKTHNCNVCAIIHLAQNIMNLILAFSISILVMFLIFYFLSGIYKEVFIFVFNSLVFQKVQLNE